MKKLLALTMLLSMLMSVWPVSLSSAVEALPESGSITAHKFHDANRNGVQDEGEEDIEGWLFRLYSLNGSLKLVAEGTTGVDGAVTFGQLPSGRYKVWEEMPECWQITTPGTSWDGGYFVMLDLSGGQQAAVEFGNVYTCTPPPPPPPKETCIDLEKTGPETAEPGETIVYHFWVKNCGDVVLKGGAQVYDLLFGSEPIWSGDLEPGQVVEFDMPYTLPEDYCGDFTNNAWAVGHPPGYPEVRDDDSWTVGVVCEPELPAYGFEKYVNGQDADTLAEAVEVNAGDTLTFLYVVTNEGNVPIVWTGLTDDVFGDLTSECGLPQTIEVGQFASCEITRAAGDYPQGKQNVGTASVTGLDDQSDPAWYKTPEPSPATLILEPDEAVNGLPTDTSHEFTATVLDQYGDPMAGVWVSFSTDFGHFEGDGQYVEVLTDGSGQATVTVVSTTAGTAHIRAWVDDGDDVYTEGELTDEPSVKIWEGEGPTSLEVWKTVEALWARSYDWSITKSVEPEALELGLGESGEVVYSIEVVRAAASESYSVEGTIYAQNDVENAAHILLVEDALEYKLPGPGDWVELTRVTVAGESWIPAGGLGEWAYSFAFDPVEGATYRNVAYVTLANHPDGEHVFLYRESFDLPGEPTSEEDECAKVTDVQTVPDGFSAVDDYPESGWDTCGSETFTIHKTVTNDSAEPGTYYLDNIATVTEQDTQESATDDATVTITVPQPAEPCVGLTKTINGPYRTLDDLFLTDGIIPVAVMREINPSGPENNNEENLFYFMVEITVENCGGVELTGVEVTDSFSNEAQPFETDDPGNVTITPPPNPYNGMVKESLTWSVGTIPVGQSRTLHVKVGTEFNPSGRLEPTSAPQTIFYNGQDEGTGSASVTTDEGLSASVGAMAIRNGNEISCAGSMGEWYNLDWQTGSGNIRPHDKCAQITTSLPITLVATDPPAVVSFAYTASTVESAERAAAMVAPQIVATFDRMWRIVSILGYSRFAIL